MHVYELIKKKRDGSELSRNEIEFLINGYLNGSIPDYQMSAFLMCLSDGRLLQGNEWP
jgi:pyrimidine-nucleoside phosphorylase